MPDGTRSNTRLNPAGYIAPSTGNSVKFDDLNMPVSSNVIWTFRMYLSDIPRCLHEILVLRSGNLRAKVTVLPRARSVKADVNWTMRVRGAMNLTELNRSSSSP